jgi:hypothetical protein
MREIGRIFCNYCQNKHSTGQAVVPRFMTWLNMAVNDSTGYTLYQIQFGRKPQPDLNGLINYPPESSQEQTPDEVIITARQRMHKRAKHVTFKWKNLAKSMSSRRVTLYLNGHDIPALRLTRKC